MTSETFELTARQAELYETKFVPALFAEWAAPLVDATGVRRGDSVLDVACGTGVVARTAARRVGDRGRVTGLDRSRAMIEVAARLAPEARFRIGDAERLPFGAGQFDAVLCQASLMFFSDPEAALTEMARVVKPDGAVGLQVWGRLEASVGFLPFVEVAARHAGPDAINLLSTYFVHGDLEHLRRLVASGGLEVTSTATRMGAIRYESVDDFVRNEIESTPLIDRINQETYDLIRRDAGAALARYVTDAGVKLPIEGHIVVARPSRRAVR